MSSFFATAAVPKRGSSFFATPYDIEPVNRQIENARIRISDAGFDPGEADKRNWFEKLTNLPEDQNAFFDVLELIGRPGAAVVNAINESSQGRDALQGAWRGFAGIDRTRGADLAENMGVENKVGKFLLGTALDIGLDPLTYVPGGVLAKGIKQTAFFAGKPVVNSYKALERAVPSVQVFREGVQDAFGRAFVPDYKLGEDLYGQADDTIVRAKQAAENDIRFRTEEAMKGVADAAKMAGGVDTGTDVGRLLEKDLKQYEDVKGYEFPDGVTRTTEKQDLLDAISRAREQIKTLGKEAKETGGEYNSAISELADGLTKTEAKIRRMFLSLERQAGKEIDKETRVNLREASRELARIESQLNNFGANEASLLRYYKKLVRDNHESQFDLVKRIREYAKSGISGIAREELPDYLKPLWRAQGGVNFGKVAQELGYTYESDLIDAVARLDGVPRRLDNQTLETLARQEMERTGAVKSLDETRKQLEQARDAIQKTLGEPLGDAAAEAETRAFAKIAENPEYEALEAQRQALKKQLNDLRMESRANTAEKVKAIKDLEDEILGLKESIRNPIVMQKEIPRPVREYSTDPQIQQAARQLLESNNALRQWALDSGVDVKELEGYMTHILSQEERKRRQTVNAMPIDRGNSGTGQPNKNVVKSRELMGSVEDINEQTGRTFFEPNAYFATAVGQKRLIEYVNAAKFRREVLSNPRFAQKYEKGMEVPKNAVVIDTNNYKFLPDEMGEMAEEIGGEYVVTKSVKTALDRYKKLTSDEGINGFLKAFDTLQSGWKRLALFSVPYHLRNDIGAKFNNWVGGMNLANLAKYSAQADKEVYEAIINGVESDLYREFRQQGLGSSGLSAVEFARRGEEPEEAIRRTIEKRSEFDGTLLGRIKAEAKSLKNPLNAFETSRDFGNFIDQTNRYALYKWAREKGLTPEQAAAKVREVQFDYTRTTPLESEVLARIAPFYRWMRNNLPFQIRQFINDPRKYANINDARINAQEAVGIEEENVPDWMKESFAMPVYGDGSGDGKFLGFNLPIGDLAKLSDPLKLITDAVTPLAKLPAELALNRNFFYDKPIEKFEGQEKQFQVPFGGPEFGVDATLAYILEQLTGQPGRALSGYLQRPESADQDTMFRMPSLGISSLIKDFDVDKAKYFEGRQDLQQLLDLIRFIEQQTGQEVRTVNEINRGR